MKKNWFCERENRFPKSKIANKFGLTSLAISQKKIGSCCGRGNLATWVSEGLREGDLKYWGGFPPVKYALKAPLSPA